VAYSCTRLEYIHMGHVKIPTQGRTPGDKAAVNPENLRRTLPSAPLPVIFPLTLKKPSLSACLLVFYDGLLHDHVPSATFALELEQQCTCSQPIWTALLSLHCMTFMRFFAARNTPPRSSVID
jgi:hypothetical protein